MRVLFVSPAAELGGAERCLLDCVAALRGSGGVQVDVVALADGPLLGKARELGATAQVIEAPRELSELGESGPGSESGGALLGLVSAAPGVMRFLARLREAIAAPQPDVVHSNGMKAHLLAGLVSPVRARLVIHLHDFIGTRRASKWLLPALSRIRRRAVFIANSRAVAQDFARIAPEANVHAVYNVVDTDYFREGVAEPDWLAGLADLEPPVQETTTFGLVATYARWKGHRLFIEAAGQVCNARPELPLRFYVVGGPIYKTRGSQVQAPELLEHARSAGIESRFGLVPFQDDIARVYRALNVVVHASTQPEPFGRTIVEAMACARPVIVARAGGAAELFDEGENAFGFEPGNAAELALTMMRDLEPGVRARLGRSAREHAVAGFGRSRLAPELLRVYADGA
ncbi:MAG TPA: glycosyltransferase family 4 protein [Polyangiaceae bacterium]|jgi:glycosyltransferase involved in cell wall biosynthesis|nr:glycosyltransferase family 4 protein [Polyangiaceae bacterium]